MTDAEATAAKRPVRVFLVDDHGLFRAGVRAELDSITDEIEVVTVGDCELTEPLSSLVRAASEAMVNAAKHSGADKIDVFAEVDGDRVEMFVRDRGKGFDADAVPEDRLGLRHSVIGRMERHGGRATVRSSPGMGTEVSLEMGR